MRTAPRRPRRPTAALEWLSSYPSGPAQSGRARRSPSPAVESSLRLADFRRRRAGVARCTAWGGGGWVGAWGRRPTFAARHASVARSRASDFSTTQLSARRKRVSVSSSIAGATAPPAGPPSTWPCSSGRSAVSSLEEGALMELVCWPLAARTAAAVRAAHHVGLECCERLQLLVCQLIRWVERRGQLQPPQVVHLPCQQGL